MEPDITLRITDHGLEAVVAQAVEAISLDAPAATPKADRYQVVILGVPVFTSKKQIPDRVKVLILRGLPPEMIKVIDMDSGYVYGIGLKGPKGE